jgi:hypothetical protein
MTKPDLDREEYVEQAYFFHAYLERLLDNAPSQEILPGIGEEILSTTKLPLALDFLAGEVMLTGKISGGMARLPHYFTQFQTFIMTRAEDEQAKFDQRTALLILEREAEFRTEDATPAGMFIYHFECLARNNLGYTEGLAAVAADPIYDEGWAGWITRLHHALGTIDFADMVYLRSEYFVEEQRRRRPDFTPPYPILFSRQEGRIAKANRGKDPLLMFAAFQRHLGYPRVPRPQRRKEEAVFHPALEQRLLRIEGRLQLLESETQGGIDLSKFVKDKETPDFSGLDPLEEEDQ